MPDSLDEPPARLSVQVSSGLVWSAAGRYAQQLIQFGLSVVLARLLSPADYGLLAMVVVFTGFAAILADGGFSSAFVQNRALGELHVQTVFWTTAASGVILTVVTLIIAPSLATFYHTPALKPLFRAVAFNFTIVTLGNVPLALLQRRMQFKAIAQVGTWSLLGSGFIGVVFALLGARVWSLVAQTLAASVLNTVLRCTASKWRPQFQFSWTALRDIWHYGGNLYAFNAINHWSRSADNLIIGKYFGAPALGAYNRAYMLMLLPIIQVNNVIEQVLFPVLASIKSNKSKVKDMYLRAIGVVALVTCPIMFGLIVTAKPLVESVYGPKWVEVVPILQILAFVGMIQVMTNSSGWIFMSQGRTDLMLRLGIGFTACVLVAFAVGLFLGSVKSIAIAYGIANLLFLYPWMAIAGRLIGMQFTQVMRSVMGSFLCSMLMAAVVLLVRLCLPNYMPPWIVLGLLALSGAISYGMLIGLIKPAASRDVFHVLMSRFRARLRDRREATVRPVDAG